LLIGVSTESPRVFDLARRRSASPEAEQVRRVALMEDLFEETLASSKLSYEIAARVSRA